jgi:Transposase IS66 family
MGLPVGTRVWLAVGRADMRKGFDGLARVSTTRAPKRSKSVARRRLPTGPTRRRASCHSKSELAAAFRYMRGRRPALGRCFDVGRLALDNNPAERALRCVFLRPIATQRVLEPADSSRTAA